MFRRHIYFFVYKIVSRYIYKHFFRHIGRNSRIVRPLSLKGCSLMSIGENVLINDDAFWIAIDNDEHTGIQIGDGCKVGHYSHLVSQKNIIIEENVLIADRVFISDCNHNFEDIMTPIIDQGIYYSGNVKIGEATWIGENVCICGSSVGKHCVIGANSVVATDIPDYCVAVGNPARVIKKYDFASQKWVKLDS